MNKRAFLRKIPLEFLLFALCGVLFPLPYLMAVPWFTVSPRWMLVATIGPVVLILAARQLFPRGAWVLPVLMLIGLFWVVWRLRWTLNDMAWAVNDRYFDPEELTPDMTLYVSFCLLLWSILFMVLETSLGGHIFLSLLMLAVLLVMPVVGIVPRPEAGFLWLFFFAGFLWLHGQKRQAFSKKAGRESHMYRRIHLTTVLLSGLMFLVFAGGLQTALKAPDRLYQTVFDIEAKVYRFLDRFSRPVITQVVEGESVSRSNSYPVDQEYLKVNTDLQPESDIYLRGFSGGSYEDGVWKAADDSPIYAEIARRLGWQQYGTRMADTFDDMYFMRNTKSASASRLMTLAVQWQSGRDLPYRPYFSHKYDQFVNAAGEPQDFGGNVRLHQFYELKDMEAGSDYESTPAAQMGVSYHMLENMYREPARELYTEVPADSLGRLRQLAAENPQEDLNAITTFILYTLKTRTSYSLTPGRVPVNEDVTEYFLFESGKGFCEHYASAATLLYRLYGVPARYVTGYRVPDEDFVQDPAGYWTASVTDRMAHAWVEIFLQDFGWVPVDVTPVGDGPMPADYPGFDRSAYDRLLAEEIEQQALEERSAEEELPPDLLDHHNVSENEVQEENELPERPEPPAPPLWKTRLKQAGRILLCLFLAAVLLEGRRRFILHRRRYKDCRQLFLLLMKILHAAGLPKEIQGEEEDLPYQVGRFFSGIDAGEARRIAEKEVYGRTGASREEKMFMLRLVRTAAEKLNYHSSAIQHLWYRWGKGYW